MSEPKSAKSESCVAASWRIFSASCYAVPALLKLLSGSAEPELIPVWSSDSNSESLRTNSA